MSKDELELKLDRLIGREVTISEKIKHSSQHLSMYAGMSGILKYYDIGEEYEDIFVSIEIVYKTQGKKAEYTTRTEIGLNALDIFGIEKT